MNRISGELHADSLLKRGRDFIPVAILVTALFALLARRFGLQRRL